MDDDMMDIEINKAVHSVPDTDPLSVIINIDDPESYITTAEVINSLRPLDSSIDIVGVVQSIQNPCTTQKDGRTLTVFNFVIDCDGICLPVAIWDDDIPRIKPFIQLDMIIHLDSPFTRPQTPSKWTYGKDFILTCRSNTIVNTLGKAKSQIVEQIEQYKEFSVIENCLLYLNKKENIALNVTIKTEFRKDNERTNKRIGAVVDKDTKLLVYVMNYDDKTLLEKGDNVKIIGQLIEIQNKIHFEVKSSKDIQKLNNEKVLEEELDKMFKTPKRKVVSMNGSNETESNEKKKLKFD